MPHIDLNALSGLELRQRLDSSRAQGDATLAYEILREMAARREGKRPTAGPATPAPDDFEADDLARVRALERAFTFDPVDAEPAAAGDVGDLRLPPRATAPSRPVRPRRRWRMAASFALGIPAAVLAGWFAGWLARDAEAARWTAPPVEVARLSPPPAPAALDVSLAEPAAAPVLAPEPVPEPPAEPAEAVAPPVEVAEVERPEPQLVKAVEPHDACAAEPTPADREICADPALQRLQRDLRRAYTEALDAHEDRATLRQRQLAWRDARNTVGDPERLARLYEQRIQKLHAAAEAARAER